MYDDCRSNSNYIFRRALLATTTTTTSFTSTTLFRSFVSWQKRMLWLSHFIPGLVCYFTKFIVIWLHFIIIFDLMLLMYIHLYFSFSTNIVYIILLQSPTTLLLYMVVQKNTIFFHFFICGIVSIFTAVVLCRWIDGTLLFSSSFFPM